MLKRVKQYALIVLGVVLTAFAISVFYVPNRIVSGGVSGISTILYHLFSIPTGASFAVINVVLLLFALRWLGKDFVFKTLASAGLLSLLVQLFSYIPPVTNNTFLAALFGTYRKIILDTNLRNERAQHVYEQLGFEKVRVRENSWKDQLGNWQSAVDYELTEEKFRPYL